MKVMLGVANIIKYITDLREFWQNPQSNVFLVLVIKWPRDFQIESVARDFRYFRNPLNQSPLNRGMNAFLKCIMSISS